MHRLNTVTIFALILSLGACQASGPGEVMPLEKNAAVQTGNLHTSESPEPLEESEYAQQFNTFFDDFNRVQGQQMSSMALSSGSKQAASETILLGPSPTAAEASSERMPEGGPEQSAPALSEKQIEHLKTLLKFQVEASDTMAAQLKALLPPVELQEKHTLLLEYFTLLRSLSGSVLDEVDLSGPGILTGVEPSESFKAKHAATLERLKELAPQAAEIMFEFQLLGYRSERLELQAETMLTESDYLKQIHQSYPEIRDFSVFPLMMAMGLGQGSPVALESLLIEAETRLQALAPLHPPAEYAEAQTLLYALSKLQVQIIQIMQKYQPLPGAQASPETMIQEILSDPDFMQPFMRLGIFMTKMDDLAETLKILETA